LNTKSGHRGIGLLSLVISLRLRLRVNKNSSGDEIANVNFFYNIAHVEASDYAH